MPTSGAAAPQVAPVGSMSYAQIEQLWTANGGKAAFAPLFAAIAMAESGGNSTALNNDPNTGDYSVGLWQINYYGNLLSGRTQEFGPPAQLQGDANAQAKAAISLSNNGANLSPWAGDAVVKAINAGQPIPTQYTNGSAISIPNVPNSTPPAGQCDPAGPDFPIVGQIFSTCTVAEIEGIALMIGGGLLLFVGIALLAAAMGTGRLRGAPASVLEGAIGGDIIGKRQGQKKAAQAQSDALERSDARGQQTRRNQVKYADEPF
jgi:hypothetical protein